LYSGKSQFEPIKEEPSILTSEHSMSTVSKKSKDSGKPGENKSSVESISIHSEKLDENKLNYERELTKLDLEIEELRKENDEIQKKINVIYAFKKKEGRDEKNYYKESNINESTYAETLSSTASLYNDLNTHKRKLDADVKKYNQSIEEQEKRKYEVYQILKSYKEELLNNAETRKGSKIPRSQIEDWLATEKRYENEIKQLRVQCFTKTLEMNRLKKDLKKLDDLFEGLHRIDFEQLKIENNVKNILYTINYIRHLQKKLKIEMKISIN
jgi:hypothetical protein